jgi:ATP synthase subunit G
MAENTTGIQELMAAETRASQIVAEARIGTYMHGEKYPWGVQRTLLCGIVFESIIIDPLGFPLSIIYVYAGRGDRMKQAKVEAQILIDAYRAEKQEEFNNMVLSKGGTEGSWSQKLQADTNKEIKEMQAQFQKNAQKAVDVLLSKCCEVSLEVPTARVRATQKAAGVV